MRYSYKASLFTLIILSLTFITTSKGQSNTENPPNFIILFADDMGYGDLGIFGHPTIQTPNLDQMAMEGQKWTNFYVGASVCTPSRAALLTGRLPIRNGMTSPPPTRVLYPNSKNGLPEAEITIAEQLKKAGYATAAIGKWHLGHKEQYLPTNHGFDYYYGIPYSNDMDVTISMDSPNAYWNLWKSPERKKIETFNVPLLRNTEIIEQPAEQHTITKRYTEESLKFIKDHQEKPFFLYLAYNLPHVPLFASEKFEGKSKRGIYGDVVAEIDWSVGEVLKSLKESGLAENTVVIFTSDNGPWLVMDEEGGSAGLLKNGKGTTYEGGMREPTIFWSPEKIQPAVITDLGTTMDLFSTFSALAGVEMPTDREMDGVDLSGTLFKGSPSPREIVYYYRGIELYAIRYGDYKAHFITEGGYGDEPKMVHETPLLYNLNVDPSEKYDVAADHADVMKKIQEIVAQHNKNMVKGPNQLKDLEKPESGK